MQLQGGDGNTFQTGGQIVCLLGQADLHERPCGLDTLDDPSPQPQDIPARWKLRGRLDIDP